MSYNGTMTNKNNVLGKLQLIQDKEIHKKFWCESWDLEKNKGELDEKDD